MGENVGLVALFETYNLEGTPELSWSQMIAHKIQNLYFHIANLCLSLARGPDRIR